MQAVCTFEKEINILQHQMEKKQRREIEHVHIPMAWSMTNFGAKCMSIMLWHGGVLHWLYSC